MKVEREKPSQRRHHRVTAPLVVKLPCGHICQATNWSLGGLRLDGLNDKLPSVGDLLPLVLELPFQGFDIAFDVEAKVVRRAPTEGTVGLEFTSLSERAKDLMRHFIEDLVRGKMATVEDTICRIDVPVTPISTRPDPNPSHELPAGRWPIKSILMTTSYVSLSILIFGYICLLIYSNTMRLEVSSAVISAPLASIHVPVDGMLQPIRLEEDAILKQGQPIARILDTEIESEIADKRIELDQAKRTFERMQERYRIEANRLKLYQIVNRTDREISRAKVQAAKESLEAIDAQLIRMSTLRNKGLVAQTKVDELLKQQAIVAGRLREAELELERDTAMVVVSDRKYFNHKEFVTDLDIIALEIEEANARVLALSQQVESLEARKASMVIRSPFDARIVSVNQTGDVMVFRNQQLLTLEKLEPPTVTAFLDQEQVLEIGLADHARVYVPAIGRHINAKVYKIDRNSAFLNPKASHYTWSDSKGKSAAVSLQLDVQVDQLSSVRAGLPVVVVFTKRSSSLFVRQIFELMTAMRVERGDGTSI